MTILLINPPRVISKGNIWKKIDRALPPLGLAYIASFLEGKGQIVNVLDLQAENINSEQFFSYLLKTKPDFIGISSTTVEIEGALGIAKLSKKILPEAKIILGGAHPSIMAEEVLSDPSVDFVVRGEGEYTLYELASSSAKIPDIQGLSYKDSGKIAHNPPRPVIEDLDELPLPAYHLLPMDKYKPSLGNYKRLPAISMITSRGCPGRCTFCYTGISGKKTRVRSAKKLMEEVKLLQRDYKIKEISFYDDTFTSFKDNVREFCERLIKEKIDISWSCMSRIDFIDKDMLGLMRRSGCHQIGYGLESSNPEILRNIRKPLSLELARSVVRMTKKLGIDVRVMFMLGCPSETEETLRETISFAVKLKPDIAVFNICTPLPGTEMYAWAKNNGYLKTTEWSKYDLANVVMQLPTVSEEAIKYYYRMAYRKFYFNPLYIFKRLAKVRTPFDVKNNIKSFLSLLTFEAERKGVIKNDNFN